MIQISTHEPVPEVGLVDTATGRLAKDFGGEGETLMGQLRTLRLICEAHFDLGPGGIQHPSSRKTRTVEARRIFCGLAYSMIGADQTTIGRHLGYERSTVTSHVRRHSDLMETDANYVRHVQAIALEHARSRLGPGPSDATADLQRTPQERTIGKVNPRRVAA